MVATGLGTHWRSRLARLADARIRWIPLRPGGLGRFSLHSTGDGRHVQVRDGEQVLAEAIASDERDELVVDFDSVADEELDEYGAAIYGAIEMAALADDEQAEGSPDTAS